MSDLVPPQSLVLTFNPDSYLSKSGVNFPTQSLTVCCWVSWVKPQYQNPEYASYATGPDSATILNYDEDQDDSGDGTRFWITNPSDVAVWVGGSSTGATGIDVSNGDWFYLAVTLAPKDATNYTINVIRDGQQVVTQTVPHDRGVGLRSGSRLTLGQRFWGTQDDMFLGQFSSLSVWNRVRSQDEIRRDMTTPLSGSEQGLVLYWPLTGVPQNVDSASLTFVDPGGDDFGFNFGS
jgi:hypothetical protein